MIPAMRQALAGAGLPNLPVLPAAPGNMAIWGAARHAFSAAWRSGLAKRPKTARAAGRPAG